jgi:hypothetical protein
MNIEPNPLSDSHVRIARKSLEDGDGDQQTGDEEEGLYCKRGIEHHLEQKQTIDLLCLEQLTHRLQVKSQV